MWENFRLWLASKVAPAVKSAASAVEGEAQSRAKGAPKWLVRCLLILALAGICVGAYWLKWHFWPAKPAQVGTPVQTAGGGTVQKPPQVPGMDAAKNKERKVVNRPVASIPAADLPPEEAAKMPAVPPAPGPDNVVRGVERLDSAVIPPSRGETQARTDILPSGEVETTLTYEREPFIGWPWKDGNWKRLEIEGSPYETGAKQWDIGPQWFPLRIGNVMIGARPELIGAEGGQLEWSAGIRVRWEPFRQQYR